MNIKDPKLVEILKNIKSTSKIIQGFSSATKDKALNEIAELLFREKQAIISENKKDIAIAEKNDLSPPLLKRLKLDSNKIDIVIKGIRDLIQLDDPVGNIQYQMELDDNLILYRISWPIGVIGVIFESRPDALVQIVTLCLKSGNACILKGGKEALYTNSILVKIIKQALLKVNQSLAESILLIETREEVQNLLSYDEYIDLLIPRGSNEFVRFIQNNTRIPVMGHADGICHIYVAEDADFEEAVRIIIDAKCQYPAVCNALETLLIHKNILNDFLPQIVDELKKNGVQIKGCQTCSQILPDLIKATETDWNSEYLDLILSIRAVDNIEQAINHINTYGSGHTDGILTKSKEYQDQFFKQVDSASIMLNCSTRFADGYRYGLGAEVGISTTKLHARGPVGLEGLVIYKYKLAGSGQIVATYSGEQAKQFKHMKHHK